MEKNFIEAKSVSFTDLLNHKLKVPFYQRTYTWKEDQLKKLLTDLLEFSDSSDIEKLEYYMGAIILHDDENTHNIIDGQQRTITLLLLAKALEASLFESAKLSIDNLQSHNQIKINYQYFCNTIKDYTEEKKEKLEKVLKSLCFTKIITQSLDDAFTFFDTQNHRGVLPSASVLLKAFHLRVIPDTNVKLQAAKSWVHLEKRPKERLCLTEYNEVLEWLIHLGLWRGRRWQSTKKQSFETFDQVQDEFTIKLRTNKNTQGKSYPVFYKNDPTLKEYSYSLRQPLYQGQDFFNFIEHYGDLIMQLMKIDIDVEGKTKAIEALIKIHGVASQYSASFFTLILLVYYDRFRLDRFDDFTRKISNLLARFRYSSLRIGKVSLEKAFIRCDSNPQLISQNLIDLISNAFDAEQVIGLIPEPPSKPEDEIAGIRKEFKDKHEIFWKKIEEGSNNE